MTSSHAVAPQGELAKTGRSQTSAELRDQIKQAILAGQDAERQAAQEGAQASGRGRHTIVLGQNGAVLNPPMPPAMVYTGATSHDNGFPPQVVDISIAFFIMCGVMVIGWPLARAFGKRLERRGEAPSAGSAGTSEQLRRIEQAVDAMAIEIERISESQRFIAKLQSAQQPSRELKSS